MGLDILVIFDDGNTRHLVMSEQLHSEIFNPSTRWSSFKELRKIKDYYKADITFNTKNINTFLFELAEIQQRTETKSDELQRLLAILGEQKIKQLRVTGD